MKSKNILKLSGILSLFAGFILLVNSFSPITGRAIAENLKGDTINISAIIFILVGFIFLFLGRPSLEESTESIDISGINFEKHALERIGGRGLFPSVIKSAIENGTHYSLSHVYNKDKTRGATDVYILNNAAEVVAGDRRTRRILSISPDKKREFKNVVVLTDRNKTVKTAYVRSNSELNSFLRRYVYDSDKKRRAA